MNLRIVLFNGKAGRKCAAVGLVARGLAGLEAAARDVRRLGGTALVAQADVADAEQVERVRRRDRT
jgi:hypothetical protein